MNEFKSDLAAELSARRNRNNNSVNYSKVLLIALISISIPFTVHLLLKNKDKKEEPIVRTESIIEPAIVYTVVTETNVMNVVQTFTNYVTITNYALATITNHLVIATTNQNMYTQWLDSPVMQAWIQDDKTKMWQTALPYKDSMRSSPTLLLGLRDDGVVVWKRILK